MTESEIVIALKLRRSELGYTQADVARLLDVPKSTIYRIENFKTNPYLGSTIRYAEVLGLSIKIC